MSEAETRCARTCPHCEAELRQWPTFCPECSRPVQLGCYEVQQLAGQGGMGAVYRGWHPGLQRPVAIKVVRRDRMGSAQLLERLRREARALARLEHPGVVQIHDVGEQAGWLYLVMAWVDGESLAARLRRGPLSPTEAVRITAGLVDALAHAHGAQVIHRDLKPANVMLDQHGRPRLLDFGIAKRIDDTDGLTRPSQIIGTPAYLAPEMLTESEAGPAVDVYGLGATLYQMLSGHAPYAGDSAMQVLRQVETVPPVPLAQRAPDTPPALLQLVEQTMARDPKRRPTLEALRQALARLEGAAPAAPAAPPPGARGSASAVLALVAVIALVGWGLTTWRARRGPGVQPSPTVRPQPAPGRPPTDDPGPPPPPTDPSPPIVDAALLTPDDGRPERIGDWLRATASSEDPLVQAQAARLLRYVGDYRQSARLATRAHDAEAAALARVYHEVLPLRVLGPPLGHGELHAGREPATPLLRALDALRRDRAKTAGLLLQSLPVSADRSALAALAAVRTDSDIALRNAVRAGLGLWPRYPPLLWLRAVGSRGALRLAAILRWRREADPSSASTVACEAALSLLDDRPEAARKTIEAHDDWGDDATLGRLWALAWLHAQAPFETPAAGWDAALDRVAVRGHLGAGALQVALLARAGRDGPAREALAQLARRVHPDTPADRLPLLIAAARHDPPSVGPLRSLEQALGRPPADAAPLIEQALAVLETPRANVMPSIARRGWERAWLVRATLALTIGAPDSARADVKRLQAAGWTPARLLREPLLRRHRATVKPWLEGG